MPRHTSAAKPAQGRQSLGRPPPVPADLPGDHATFVFAGGLGSSSAPKNEGYSLTIDGNDRLRFDVPAPWESPRWKSADTRVELRFVGVCPYHGRKPRAGCSISPSRKTCSSWASRADWRCDSLGTRGPQWFALNPYHDVN